jgi:hypothetical protein
MGNTSSSTKSAETEFENFYDVVDYIATYYILTMDFKSLSKLSDKEYCDKLVIITSDILQRYLNEQQITYLEQRVKDGVEVNAINNEKFVFITKDVLEGLDIANDTKTGIKKKIKKQRVCIGIAKFYVKIAHVFGAIVMTINPVYSYKDAVSGSTMRTSLMDRDKIPKGTEKKVLKLNICDDRIRALRNNELLDEETGDATLEPEICSINMSDSGFEKTLADEPGISELMHLYFDKYDEKTGSFTGMTTETEKLFQKDLKDFYTTFTGNSEMPPEITRFSDIKLRDYDRTTNCMPPDGKLRSKVQISQKNPLFVAYASNVKRMIQSAADNQIKLLEVINNLFDYTIDPKTQKRVIRVNPKLTEATLQENVEKTRKMISTLYLKCELDFEEGVKIMNAIVESKEAVILPRQIKVLSDESDILVKSAVPLAVPLIKEEDIPQPNTELSSDSPSSISDLNFDSLEGKKMGTELESEIGTETSSLDSGKGFGPDSGFASIPDSSLDANLKADKEYGLDSDFASSPDATLDSDKGFGLDSGFAASPDATLDADKGFGPDSGFASSPDANLKADKGFGLDSGFASSPDASLDSDKGYGPDLGFASSFAASPVPPLKTSQAAGKNKSKRKYTRKNRRTRSK